MSEMQKPEGMYCSISGILPDVPVVSAKSGHLFERRLIEQALEASGGRCPETGQPLSRSDLIEVRKSGTVVEPTVPPDVAVPSVLRHLQKEWDRSMLEMHQVKTKLNETRKELATALYNLDAAHRVIADLRKQLEGSAVTPAAANKAADGQANVNGPSSATEKRNVAPVPAGGDADASGDAGNTAGLACSGSRPAAEPLDPELVRLPARLLSQAEDLAKALQTKRKARVIPRTHANAAKVSSFSETASLSIDGPDTTVTALARGPSGVAYAGTSSGKVCRLSLPSLRLDGDGVQAHDGMDGGVRQMRWHSSAAEHVMTCGGDGLVKMWDSQSWGMKGAWRHASAVVDVDVHPLGVVGLAVLADGGWVWRELEAGGAVECHGRGEEGGYASGAIHPDGMVFATGRTDGIVEMWDVGSMKCVAQLGEKGGKVGAVEMSEKGYYMVTWKDEKVELWDLRKQGVCGTVDIEGVGGVALDGVGEFGCAVGEMGVSIFAGKKRAKRLAKVSFEKSAGKIEGRVGCVWGEDAGCLLAGGGDGVVRQFGAGVQ